MKVTIRATETMTFDFQNEDHLKQFLEALSKSGVQVEVVSKE